MKCRLHKQEDLGLNPQHSCKKLGVAVHTWNSVVGRVGEQKQQSF